MNNQIIQGDALAILRGLPDHSVDSIVTDPPAGISFMGKDWDNPNTFPTRKRPENYTAKFGHSMTSGPEWSYNAKARDGFIAFMTEIFTEARRVLRPGGHALVWSIPRTSHWTATALEDAGFEIRDCVYHLFGSGMPKSHNISKAIDRMAGQERSVIGARDSRGLYDGSQRIPHEKYTGNVLNGGKSGGTTLAHMTAPATPEAAAWDGWGTALKPAVECWWLARAPLASSNIASNVLEYGTGAINIDACRIEAADHPGVHQSFASNFNDDYRYADRRPPRYKDTPPGRWPANVVLSHTLYCQPDKCAEGCAVAELDRQSGQSKGHASGYNWEPSSTNGHNSTPLMGNRYIKSGAHFGDQGGASRFFYVPKASKAERNAGCQELPLPEYENHNLLASKWCNDPRSPNGGYENKPSAPIQNHHPTVKPIKLMQYLARLITPPGGVVLDMFGGSGTTALACIEEGFGYLLIEQDPAYVEIARARAAHAERQKLMEAG